MIVVRDAHQTTQLPSCLQYTPAKTKEAATPACCPSGVHDNAQ